MKLAQINGGVVANIIAVDPDNIPDWAHGWPVLAGDAGLGWSFDGQVFMPPVGDDPHPTGDDVNAERDRRVRAGLTVTVTDIGPVRIDGREVDMRNLQGLVTMAQMRLAAGDAQTVTQFRDADNVIRDLTPPQIIELWSAGMSYVSAVFSAAWTLKDFAGGIPADFSDDAYWPQRSAA